ncbi:hypothetical protein [Amycolatopsis dongchuanensis]
MAAIFFDDFYRSATAIVSGREIFHLPSADVLDAITEISQWNPGDMITDELVNAERVVQNALGGRGRKSLFEMKPAQRRRLLSNAGRGKTRTQARGHGATPERPQQADRHPQRYAEYQAARVKALPVAVKDEGVIRVAGLNKRDRSKVAKHHNAINKYLDSGIDMDLARFEGRTVGGYGGIPRYELETRLQPIEDWGNQGQFDYESFYQEVA